MNHLEFFGLGKEPFNNAPITGFYFESQPHSQAMIRIRRSLESMQGLAVLTGEVGCGKTMLCRKLLYDLPEEEFKVSLIILIHPDVTGQWFLLKVARQLGITEPEKEKSLLMDQIYGHLIGLNEEGRKAVILIDEAHHLRDKEVLSELRGLLNLETTAGRLVSLLLFGLPEVLVNLSKDESLFQRINLKYSLNALDEESTRAYIDHRIRAAGGEESPFEDQALNTIYLYSNGIPRLVNILCDNLLFEAFLLRSRKITRDLVASVGDELSLSLPTPEEEVAPSATPEEEKDLSERPSLPPVDLQLTSIEDEFLPDTSQKTGLLDIDEIIKSLEEKK